ncbi:Glycosyl_transferase family 2 protein [Hexamita inflata]|uniref:Glycosyl transferase family 2 protein n=1 Tax=Hexamita inflata TaxID=28002 RepID=A0AA86P5K5_9EUKA|nr:Glycosyl transferase family 2 protein [Hexamita inflata]
MNLLLSLCAPQISVVIPVFNKERHLRACVNSVLSQNFTDFEILIVDDGSTDDSLNVALSFNDSRISVIPLPNNTGVLHARYVGISNANGTYIINLDADDAFSTPTLFNQLLINNNTDIVHFKLERVYFNTTQNSFLSTPLNWVNPSVQTMDQPFLTDGLLKNFVGHLTNGKMIKRTVYLKGLERMGQFVNEHIVFGEDYLQMSFVFKQAKSYIGAEVMGQYYNEHDEQETQSGKMMKMVKDLVKVASILESEYESYKEYISIIVKNRIEELFEKKSINDEEKHDMCAILLNTPVFKKKQIQEIKKGLCQ